MAEFTEDTLAQIHAKYKAADDFFKESDRSFNKRIYEINRLRSDRDIRTKTEREKAAASRAAAKEKAAREDRERLGEVGKSVIVQESPTGLPGSAEAK